jgi:tRNA(Ile2) C34 agmatinyltransferase TiaS
MFEYENKKVPECPICNQKMEIDDWNGWRWTCFLCDYRGRTATNEEIAINEIKM